MGIDGPYELFDTFGWIIGHLYVSLTYEDYGRVVLLFTSSIIALISLFGSLNQDYRWFLLNQSVFQLLLVLSEFIRARLSADFIHETPLLAVLFYLTTILPTYMMLLLAISRFIAMYSPIFYWQYLKTRGIPFVIIGYDVGVIIFFYGLVYLFYSDFMTKVGDLNSILWTDLKNFDSVKAFDSLKNVDDLLRFSKTIVVYTISGNNKKHIKRVKIGVPPKIFYGCVRHVWEG